MIPTVSRYSQVPTFRTHSQFVATREPSFEGCMELSRSGNVRKFLAIAEDSTLYLTMDDPLPTMQSIPLLGGSITLVESSTSGKGKSKVTTWNVSVPVPAPHFLGEGAEDLPEPPTRGRRVTTMRSTIG